LTSLGDAVPRLHLHGNNNVTLVTQGRYAMKKSVYLVATFALLLAAEYDMEVAAGTTKTVAVDYKSF